MAYTNGYIHGNVDLRDVQRALRSSLISINSLAQNASGTINKWAKYKPQRGGTQADLTESERYLGNYGLVLPMESNTNPVALFYKYAKGQTTDSQGKQWWDYDCPTASDWHRFTDFASPLPATSNTAGYNHKATPVNTDPNPDPIKEDLNLVEYNVPGKTYGFGLDWPIMVGNIEWRHLLNGVNPSTGQTNATGKWKFCITLLKSYDLAALTQIPNANGCATAWNAAKSNGRFLQCSTFISDNDKGGRIEISPKTLEGSLADNGEVKYLAIYTVSEFEGGEPTGRHCLVYGHPYKELTISNHVDIRCEVKEIGWYGADGPGSLGFEPFASPFEYQARTDNLYFRIRFWHGPSTLRFDKVVLQLTNGPLCGGTITVDGGLSNANGATDTANQWIQLPENGSADQAYPMSRVAASGHEGDNYWTEFIFHFENVFPATATAGSGMNYVVFPQQVSIQFGALVGESWAIFGSQSITITR